jgi:fructoselysine-6-P-deglycase FrlB-like protein
VSRIAQEIASQPDLWLRSVSALDQLGEHLPPEGADVVVVGCGTSLYVARAWAAAREEAGHGRTDAFPASELPSGREYDALLAISRSGTTTEVERLLAAAPDRAATHVVTAVAGSPVVSAAGHAAVLDFADEFSVVQTRFATCALALLLAHAGVDLMPSVEAGRAALEAPLPVDPEPVRQWVFLGSGWTVGLAEEAGLKMREAAQAWTEAYPAMEYRHGPISVADAGTVVWPIGELDPALRSDIERTGATVVPAAGDPLATLVTIQRTAVALAEARGLDPDAPRNLTRSVVLSPTA